MKIIALPLLIFLLNICVSNVYAGADGALKKMIITQDQQTLQRGFMVYYEKCRLCHELQFIKYQNLLEIGFDQQYVDRMRGTAAINTSIPSTTKPEIAHKLFGLVPPDLSLMAKARKNGPHYIFTLLTSYEEISEASYENKYFKGIKMPDVFAYSLAQNDIERHEIEEKTQAVSNFLLWASDPRASDRTALGKYVIAYLILLSTLMYLVMKRVWKRLD